MTSNNIPLFAKKVYSLLPADKVDYNFLSNLNTSNLSLPFFLKQTHPSKKFVKISPHLETQVTYAHDIKKDPSMDFEILFNSLGDINTLNTYQIFHILLLADNFDWNTTEKSPAKSTVFKHLNIQQKKEVLELSIKVAKNLDWGFPEPINTIEGYDNLLTRMSHIYSNCDLISVYEFLFSTESYDDSKIKNVALSKIPLPLMARLLTLNQLDTFIDPSNIDFFINQNESNIKFFLSYFMNKNISRVKAIEVQPLMSKLISSHPETLIELTPFIYGQHNPISPKEEVQIEILTCLDQVYKNQIKEKTLFSTYEKTVKSLKDLRVFSRIFARIKDSISEEDANYYYENLVLEYAKRLNLPAKSLKHGIKNRDKFHFFFNDTRHYSTQELHANVFIGIGVCSDRVFEEFWKSISETIFSIKPLFFGSFTSIDYAKKFVSHILLILLSQANIDNPSFSNDNRVRTRIQKIYSLLESNLIYQYILNIHPPPSGYGDITKAIIINDDAFILYLSQVESQSTLMRENILNWEKIFPIDWNWNSLSQK